MPWGRQARAGRPRAGHSPPANPWAPPRWPGAGLLSGSPLAGSSGPRPVSPLKCLGGPVGTQRFSVAAPRGSVGCQARDWAAEAWCPAWPVSCTDLAVPSWGPLLSCAAAVPRLPASAQGGCFSCSSPQPPPPGAHSPQQLPAPCGPPCWGWGYSGSLGRQPTAPVPALPRRGPPLSVCRLLNWEGWCICLCFSCLGAGLGPHTLGSGTPCAGLCAHIPVCLQEP